MASQSLQIREIENLLQDGKKVFVKSLNNEYTQVSRFINKGVLDTYKVTLENGKTVDVTHTHRFFTDTGWTETRHLINNKSAILCDDKNYYKVKSVEYIGKRKIVDITVKHSEHCYFGNNMLHHNSGKSFLGYQILAQTQKIGGMAILIDTENSTDKNLLPQLGLDIKKLVYLQPDTIEDVFSTIEHTVKKIKENNINKPVTIVWDSVAATPAKAELDAAYDANTMGLGARVVSRSLRKIMKFIGDNNVTLVFINQLRMKLNLANKYEDPWVTPYGKAIPFHASVRLRLTHDGSADMVIEEKKHKDFFGVGVKAKVVKNRISPPFRTCSFSIEFYKGVTEHLQIYDKMVKSSPCKFKHDEKQYTFTAKNGGWHEITILDENNNTVYSKKFRKTEIQAEIFDNEELKPYVDDMIDVILTAHYSFQELTETENVPTDDALGEVDA